MPDRGEVPTPDYRQMFGPVIWDAALEEAGLPDSADDTIGALEDFVMLFFEILREQGVLHIEYRINDDGAGGQSVGPDGVRHSYDRPATKSQRLVGVWQEVTS